MVKENNSGCNTSESEENNKETDENSFTCDASLCHTLIIVLMVQKSSLGPPLDVRGDDVLQFDGNFITKYYAGSIN